MVQVTLLLLSTLLIVVESFDVGGHDFLETTFAYRKKSNTPTENHCIPSMDVVCYQQSEYCGAFHVGKNFFATTAHCLVGVDRYIQDPNELEIVGLGKVNVSITLHHNYANMTGPDVAWIQYNHTEEVPSVRVAVNSPIKCSMFKLEVFNSTARGMHAGIRWTEIPIMPRAFSIKENHPDVGQRINKLTGHEYAVFSNKNSERTSHVVLCTAKGSAGLYEVHYMQVGRLDDYLVTIDCHFVKCGYVAPENMVIPYTTTTTESPMAINLSATESDSVDSEKPLKTNVAPENMEIPSTTTTTESPLVINLSAAESDSVDSKKPRKSKTKPKYNWGTLPTRSYADYRFWENPSWASWSPVYKTEKFEDRTTAGLLETTTIISTEAFTETSVESLTQPTIAATEANLSLGSDIDARLDSAQESSSMTDKVEEQSTNSSHQSIVQSRSDESLRDQILKLVAEHIEMQSNKENLQNNKQSEENREHGCNCISNQHKPFEHEDEQLYNTFNDKSDTISKFVEADDQQTLPASSRSRIDSKPEESQQVVQHVPFTVNTEDLNPNVQHPTNQFKPIAPCRICTNRKLTSTTSSTRQQYPISPANSSTSTTLQHDPSTEVSKNLKQDSFPISASVAEPAAAMLRTLLCLVFAIVLSY